MHFINVFIDIETLLKQFIKKFTFLKIQWLKKIPEFFFTYRQWKRTGLDGVRDQVTLPQLLLLLMMIMIKGGETNKNNKYVAVMIKIIMR